MPARSSVPVGLQAVQSAAAKIPASRRPPLGFLEAFVSLHAATTDLHDRLVRVPGAFRLTVAGARNLLECGVAVGFNMVLTRENMAEAESLAESLPALISPRVALASPPRRCYKIGKGAALFGGMAFTYRTRCRRLPSRRVRWFTGWRSAGTAPAA
ncbi:MAG: hypothetical protein QME96_09315 [Myxococcota bacterium]|nr:hypothetical protein [Myxococcota bacterium]